MKCRRHHLKDGAAVPAGLVATIAAAVQDGRLVALPTETVYGLAMRPGDAAAVAAVQHLKGRPATQPFTYHLAAAEDAARLGVVDDARVRRLIRRYWPGPLTLVVPGAAPEAVSATAPAARRSATPGCAAATVGLRLPAHDFTRAVIAAVGVPLWMTSINRSGEPPMCDPEAIAAAFGDQLHHLVDAGPSPLGNASTVVRCTGPELEVLREGILSRREVMATAEPMILFVCTGNTCRSPLAEAVARQLAQAGGLVGYSFRSAGTGAGVGFPASEGSLAAAREIGLDLSQHRSTPLDERLLRRATRIYTLSASHHRAILRELPELAGRLEPLAPGGIDIADPFGGDLASYRLARDAIVAAVTARAAEWQAGESAADAR